MTFIDRDDYDMKSGTDPREADELAAAGLHVVTADDEDEEITDIDPSAPKAKTDKDVADFEDLDEDELSEEEREKQDALADFMPDEEDL